MKKYNYDITAVMLHGEGLPGYVPGETVTAITDSARKNLILHDNKRGRMIILSYSQIISVAYGTIPSSNGAVRTSAGFLVGGFTGAVIGAAAADPQKNSVIIQYRSSAGDQRQIVLNVHPSRISDGSDLAGILNANIDHKKSGPIHL